jgi:ATP-binding protein involved in chromosome partitioning
MGAEASESAIQAKLETFIDPYSKQSLANTKAIQKIEKAADKVRIHLTLGYPMASVQARYISDLTAFLADIVSAENLSIEIKSDITPHAGTRGLKSFTNIKNMIAVASGKGGVGKSTTAVNLAIALSQAGARVGILDADIYGPSQPMMLGGENSKEAKEQKVLLPVIRHGIQSMSIGYLIDEKTAMIWRGPMVTMALQQLLNDTQWDHLDYLIIDLPPGTGDIQLTLSQKIPLSGAVIVTTPQDLSLLDARRAYEMFIKVHVPVLGVIENMSTHICTQCGHEESIFGEGGGDRFAQQYDIRLLGSLPLDSKIRAQTDAGTPPVAADPESKVAHIYRDIALQVAARLSLQQKDYSHKFPNIIVKND